MRGEGWVEGSGGVLAALPGSRGRRGAVRARRRPWRTRAPGDGSPRRRAASCRCNKRPGRACTRVVSRARVRRRRRRRRVAAAKASARGPDIADDPTPTRSSAFESHAEHDAGRLLGRASCPSAPARARINSDLAFKGNYAFMGTYDGFRVHRHHEPREPGAGRQLHGLHRRPGRRRRLREHPRALVGLADQRRRRRDAVLRRHARRPGLRGRPHLRHHRPDEPGHDRRGNAPADGKQGLRFSTGDNPRTGCGSHTATAVPPPRATRSTSTTAARTARARGWTSSRSRSRTRPRPSFVKQAPAGRQCHDNTVFINGANSLASCAGGNGISVFKFDATIDPTLPGGIENPMLLWSKRRSTGRQRSATRPRSATTARRSSSAMSRAAASRRSCQTTSSALNKSLFFLNAETGDTISHAAEPARPDAASRTAPGTTSTPCRPRAATSSCPATTRPAST